MSDGYKRKLEVESPHPEERASKRHKATMEGPLTLTQLSTKYPDVFGGINTNTNLRPWMDATSPQAWDDSSQSGLGAGKARAPGPEEERFWRGDGFNTQSSLSAMYGCEPSEVEKENAMLRWELEAAQRRLRALEKTTTAPPVDAWGMPYRSHCMEATQVPLPIASHESKSIFWTKDGQFSDKMTTMDWNNEAVRVFRGHDDEL